MKEEEKIRLRSVVETIFKLAEFVSDKRRTLDSWLGKLKNSLTSPGEIVCMFFDGLALEEIIKTDITLSGLTEEELRAMIRLERGLNNYLKAYPNDGVPEQIIESDEWSEVREAAQELINKTQKSGRKIQFWDEKDS